ncbi:hypothetical protein ACB092_11G018500 [Castanea dentata]
MLMKWKTLVLHPLFFLLRPNSQLSKTYCLMVATTEERCALYLYNGKTCVRMADFHPKFFAESYKSITT